MHDSHKVTFRNGSDSLELDSLLASQERASHAGAADDVAYLKTPASGHSMYSNPEHNSSEITIVEQQRSKDDEGVALMEPIEVYPGEPTKRGKRKRGKMGYRESDDIDEGERGGMSGKKGSKATPVPYLQVSFVAIWRMSQALFFIVLMPFINTMLVEDLHVASEASVGKYSGLVEAAAAAGMISGVFLFAHLSDKYGRKWVTLIGVGVASVLCGAFGFGRTLGQLLFLRFAMGFANSAQAATARVMISEMTDKTNEAISFAWMGTGWQVGATVAPVLGAGLARPALTWPRLFAGTIFDTYPYALPCIAAAIIPGVTVLFAIFLSHETHPGKRAGGVGAAEYMKIPNSAPSSPALLKSRVSHDSTMGQSSLGSREGNEEEQEGMLACGAGFILLMRFLILVQALWSGAAELLLFFSSKKIGGLGLTQGQMSIFLALRPLLVCLYTLFVCPILFRRFTAVQIMRIFTWFCPLATGTYLMLAGFASAGTTSTLSTIVCLGAVLVFQSTSNPYFLASNILLNGRAPNQRYLSRLNAYSELTSQLGIGLGAEVGSVMYAWSNEYDILPGRLSWICLTGFSVLTALIAQKLTHRDGWRERLAEMEEKEREKREEEEEYESDEDDSK